MKNKHSSSPFFYCLSPILVFFLINYLVSLVFVIYAIMSEGIMLNSPDAVNILTEFSDTHIFEMEFCAYAITFCFVYFIKYRRVEKKCFDNKYLNLLEFKDIVLAIGCGLGIYLLTDIIIVILDGIFNMQSLITAHNETVSALFTDSIIKDIILIGIMAPITEEILFRGLVFNRMRLFIEEKHAIILSAIVFAFMHIGTVIQIGYAFILGFALAYSYVKFENIKIPIIMHMAFNLTNCLFYIPILNELLHTTIGYLVYYIAGIGLTVFTAKKLRNKNKPLRRDDLIIKEDEMLKPW